MNSPNPLSPGDLSKARVSVGVWESLPSRKFIETAPGQTQQWGTPTPRAVCTMVSWGDGVYVFGGFDGTRRTNEFSEYSFQNKCWYAVKGRGIPPAPRDRHTAVVAGNMMYVFGGHDGDRRLGDTHAFDFVASRWLTLLSAHSPTARQSHCMATYKPAGGAGAAGGAERIYLFGGFDGSYRNDLHVLDLSTHQWSKVVTTGNGPTPRYRSTMVCACNVLVVFGGHDGSTFLNDVYVFHPDTSTWSRIHATNLPPLPRDSHTAVAFGESIIVFGGSSGAAMNDLHELSLSVTYTTTPEPSTATLMSNGGNGHYSTTDNGSSTSATSTPTQDLTQLLQQAIIAGAAGNSEGTTPTTNTVAPTPSSPAAGAASKNEQQKSSPGMAPLVLTDLASGGSVIIPQQQQQQRSMIPQFHATWSPLFPGGAPPHPRFCHAAVLYGNSRILVFGGFDGKKRNHDLFQLKLSAGRIGTRAEVAPGTLMMDLTKLVASNVMADVTFVVDGGERVPGHRLLLNRIPFFAKLFAGGIGAPGDGLDGGACVGGGSTTPSGSSSGASVIEIKSCDRETFLNILRYAYTDECDISSKSLVKVFQAAERFGIERLKAMCENTMLDTLDANNASLLFASADKYGASNLRALAFNYIIANFDQVSVTSDFEDMGRTRVDLVFEVLKRRGAAVKAHQ